jgi:type I restriction enzyme S subunit
MQLLQHFKELTVNPKNAKELKGLILQLAIQGKLTANWRAKNLDIKPASELFKEIQKEKEQLIEAKKIKKEKEFTKIKKDEIPYKIPVKWSWYKLAELSAINGGFAFKSSNYIDEGARVIRISDFDENGFKNHKIVRHLYSDALDAYVLEDKNILIAMTGGTVGKSLFVDKVPEVMVVNQRVATIKIFKPIYEAYINCVIPTKLIQDVIEEAKNSTNDNISMSDIKGFNIPLPPLEEQKEIVKVVETLFKEVAQLEQLTVERIRLKEDFVTSALNQLTTNSANQEWAFLQEHFKSFLNETTNIKKLRETVLQLAVQGKLTADWRANNPDQFVDNLEENKKYEFGFEMEIPSTWKMYPIGNIMNFQQGMQIAKSTRLKEPEKGALPILRIKNYHDGFKSDVEYIMIDDNSLIAEPDDIILTRTGESRGWVLTGHKGVFHNNTFRINYPKDKIAKNFLKYYISSRDIQYFIKSNSGRTGQPDLSHKKFGPCPFAVPPLEEQKVIVQKVNALMGLCDSLEQEVQQSQEQIAQLMQSCLREVFEGESKTEEL